MKISAKQKKVYCNDITKLTDDERKEVAFLIGDCGYSLAKERKGTGNKLNKASIYHCFYVNNKDKGGLKTFQSVYNETIIDKRGKERKAGFLVAKEWFKNNYSDYEIVSELTDDEKKWIDSII